MGLSPANQPASQPATSQARDRLVLSMLGSSGSLWASLGIFEPLCGSQGLSGPLWAPWASLKKTRQCKYTHNDRQLGTQFSSRLEIARRKNQTIPDSWSPSVLRGSPGPSQPASPPASQPTARQACFIHAVPLWASLGLSVRLHMCLSEALWASLGFSGALAANYHGIFPRYVT